MRTGNPWNTPPWEWRCGFYPGSDPGGCRAGVAPTFAQPRRLRGSLARLPTELHRRRLHRVSTAARLDCLEICNVGCGAEKRGPSRSLGTLAGAAFLKV